MLRTQKVNGPLYAFDRGTGKRLWCYGDGLLREPVAGARAVRRAAGDHRRRAGDATQEQPATQLHPVVVIEKARGRLLFDKPVIYNSQFFQNLTVNQKNGTIELNRYELPDRDHRRTSPRPQADAVTATRRDCLTGQLERKPCSVRISRPDVHRTCKVPCGCLSPTGRADWPRAC